jgi:hypothetical protein
MAVTQTKRKTRAEGAMQLAKSLAQMLSCSQPDTLVVAITEVGPAQCRYIIDDRRLGAVVFRQLAQAAGARITPGSCTRLRAFLLFASERVGRANWLTRTGSL